MPLGSNKEILIATTDAGTSESFDVDEGKSVAVFCEPDLGSTETADIQICTDGIDTYVDYVDGTAVELTSTQNGIKLYGPGRFRVAKDATASATAIRVQE